jgi:alpha-tubulin suppressor-like RCC1 family protein
MPIAAVPRLGRAVTFFVAAVLAACGGEPSSPAAAQAALESPASGKVTWSLSTATQFRLRNQAGAPVSGPLTCTSDAPAELVVGTDCASVSGRRLGTHTVTVTAGGVSAKAQVKVIAPPYPLGSHGAASSHGSGQYNLVVTPDGRVLAWGANPGGALGQGQTEAELTRQPLPVAVKDGTGQDVLRGIVAVSAGSVSALALTEDGEVYSWGLNDDNRLGRAAPNGDALPGKVLGPAGGAALRGIVAVSAGDSNAVALGDDGAVYSWGRYTGQSGAEPKATPGQVNAVGGGGPLTGAVAVSAGSNWSAALLADGRVVTWGFGADGRQGQGTLAPGPAFTQAPGFVVRQGTALPLSGVVALSAGYNFGLALIEAGEAYAWGNNSFGQLGQNSAGITPVPGAVAVLAPGGAAPMTGLSMVAAGGNHALAMTGAGAVFSWGYSQDGQLGDGPFHPRLSFSPLPAPVVGAAGAATLTGVASIAAGYAHGLALASDGRVFIWGDGLRGNLGQGGPGEADSYAPLSVWNEAGSGALSLAPLGYWANLLQRGR